MYKKIGRIVLNQKVRGYLLSRQIFKFGLIKKEKIINKI